MTLFPQYNTVTGGQLPLAMFMPVGWEQKGCRMPPHQDNKGQMCLSATVPLLPWRMAEPQYGKSLGPWSPWREHSNSQSNCTDA